METLARESRYERNGIFTDDEQNQLKLTRVAVVGLGGLGGYVAEQLVRLGVGQLVLVDGDVFNETNLNRQLFSTEATLGHSKARAAQNRLKAIDSQVDLRVYEEMLTRDKGLAIIEGCHIVVDALDNNLARRMLLDLCGSLGLPMVYGAIAGWYGQVATEVPGDGTLLAMLNRQSARGMEQVLGNPAFTPALVASLQVAEVVKLITGKGKLLRRGFLYCDTLENDYEWIPLQSESS